jgi:PilZ domain
MPSEPTSSNEGSPVRNSRSEARMSAVEPVQLYSLDQPSIIEPVRTQNISARGARVMTQRIWEPGTRLLIKSLRSDFWARARVVYWRSFSNTRFAMGLEFVAWAGNWPTEKSAS